MSEPFWKTTPLDAMTPEQWESLCDGCGRCCLLQLEDEDDGTIYRTCIACRLLDVEKARCSDYQNRFAKVDACLQMTPEHARSTAWLPETCAYRRVARGLDLLPWHPLVSGDPETVHTAGISVRGKAIGEGEVEEDTFEDYILEPGERLTKRS